MSGKLIGLVYLGVQETALRYNIIVYTGVFFAPGLPSSSEAWERGRCIWRQYRYGACVIRQCTLQTTLSTSTVVPLKNTHAIDEHKKCNALLACCAIYTRVD